VGRPPTKGFDALELMAGYRFGVRIRTISRVWNLARFRYKILTGFGVNFELVARWPNTTIKYL